MRGKERPTRRSAKPAKSRVEAKPPIIRKSRKSEGARVHDLEKRLAEALDQQTAASEILRVISSSPTDVQPVFDAIVLNASRLCGGEYAIVIRYDGEMMHLAAQHNPRPGAAEPVAQLFPRAPTRVMDRRTFISSMTVGFRAAPLAAEALDAGVQG